MIGNASGATAATPPALLVDHFAQLHEQSGIAPEVITERGYFSATSPHTLRALGFSHAQARLHPALVLPVCGPEGSNGLYTMRPDVPRLDVKGKPRKYELPPKAGVRLDCPPRCRALLSNPTVELWITEGQKKADALASHGFCAVALLGVWGFKGRNDLGGVTLLADFDYIAWNGRQVRIVFDNDVMRKAPVQAALARLIAHLERKGAAVRAVYLPASDQKIGVDDYLRTHTAAELCALATAPRAFSAADGAPAASGVGADGYRLTDSGNAERLTARHGDTLRYCAPWGRWLVWSGQRWQRDEAGRVLQLAKETIRQLYAVAATVEDSEARAKLVAWAQRSEAIGRLKAMVELAQSEAGVPVPPAALDCDPWLLNVGNGTVDLRTGQLRPADPTDLLTQWTPTPYAPNAACPTWERFLARVLPDAAVRAFVQRVAGYAATGDVSEQCLFFLYGFGANGKSTFLGTLQAALGDYARQAAPQVLLASRYDRHPTEQADLFGARLVASVEVEDGRRLAEVLVKQLTGGDRIKARFMRQDYFEWEPTHTILLAANHKPVVRGTDHAIWRRIHLIPFEVTIPPSQQDRALPAKLRAELPGILRWIIDGCLAWQRDGLAVPDVVQAATEAYRAEQDVLAPFLEDRCILREGLWSTSKALYAAYEAWCDDNGAELLKQQTFGRALTERGFSRKPGTGGVRGWRGIGLRQNEPAGSAMAGASGASGASGTNFPHPPMGAGSPGGDAEISATSATSATPAANGDAADCCRVCGKPSGGRVRCPTCQATWLRGGLA